MWVFSCQAKCPPTAFVHFHSMLASKLPSPLSPLQLEGLGASGGLMTRRPTKGRSSWEEKGGQDPSFSQLLPLIFFVPPSWGSFFSPMNQGVADLIAKVYPVQRLLDGPVTQSGPGLTMCAEKSSSAGKLLPCAQARPASLSGNPHRCRPQQQRLCRQWLTQHPMEHSARCHPGLSPEHYSPRGTTQSHSSIYSATDDPVRCVSSFGVRTTQCTNARVTGWMENNTADLKVGLELPASGLTEDSNSDPIRPTYPSAGRPQPGCQLRPSECSV